MTYITLTFRRAIKGFTMWGSPIHTDHHPSRYVELQSDDQTFYVHLDNVDDFAKVAAASGGVNIHKSKGKSTGAKTASGIAKHLKTHFLTS